MKTTTQKIVISSMLAALVCVVTMIIKVPSPLKGYINLGDCVVLLCGYLLSPLYGFLASGVGSALADVFSGYIVYAPATFVIKGIMAVVVFYGFKILKPRIGKIPARLIGGFVAEVIMVLGYLLFEGVLYGFVPSLANIPANSVQGAAGLVIGLLLIRIFDKNKMIF